MSGPLLCTGVLAAGLALTVDRIEGSWAVVEWADGSLSDLPLGLLPAGTHEGQRLVLYAQQPTDRPPAQPQSRPAVASPSPSPLATHGNGR